MASPTRTGGGVVTLFTGTIAAAGTAFGTVTGLGGCDYVGLQQAFVYGSSGGTVLSYVQTSFDAGVTWFDIAASKFTSSTATRIYAVGLGPTAGTANTTPADGSLTADTTLTGFIGDRLRAKVISTGTYAGATSLTITAAVKNT